MKKCKCCPQPVEAEQYQFCKKCWWNQDPRNEKNKLDIHLGKYPSIHFNHDEVVYVPCYQKNPQKKGDGYPTFTYSLSEASHDEQMVASLNPDYILVLKGTFNAKTQPFDLTLVEFNQGANLEKS